ncbi:hypothetical protein K3495_g9288 [Podosphaera aphanis]|nr:hypothetical protein K3495_g9288 [Podosphaera aphanis]
MSLNIEQTQWLRKSYPSQEYSIEQQTLHPSSFINGSTLEKNRLRLPAAIPAVRDSSTVKTGRTLIICLDGTGDQFDDDNSNVVNFVQCLKKDDPRQVTYYQTGIGTYNERGMRDGISAAVDMSVGSGLGIHIKDAYRFLMQTYREGDRICLFGFSRGSYTVRCLAGMLHKVGLLPAHNRAQINFAYNFYKNDTPEGWEMSREFKKTFCADVNVYFVGIWDCVASVGFIPRKLPFSKSPTNNIGYFRHAMALDEHRSKFKICHYAHDDPAAKPRKTARKGPRFGKQVDKVTPKPKRKVSKGEEKSGFRPSALKRVLTLPLVIKKETDNQKKLEAEFEQNSDKPRRPPTDALEVWFCGGHADVGGGAVKNWERHVLARIPLRWMIRQCFECNTGILFKTTSMAETGIDVPTLWPVYQQPKRPVVGPSPTLLNKYVNKEIAPLHRRSSALNIEENLTSQKEKHGCTSKLEPTQENTALDMPPEQAEDYFDALAPINDQLELAKGWWILEFWPVKIRRQKEDSDEWEKVVRMNMGSYRAIRELEPKMHWTVEQRMIEKGYKIKANVHRHAVWKVVI